MSMRIVTLALLAAACSGDKTDTYSTPTDGDADTDADADADADTDADTDSASTGPTETGTAPIECIDVVLAAPFAGTFTTSTGPIDTGTVATGDSGSNPATYTYLLIDALFGINLSGCIDEVILDGQVIDSSINLTFGDAAWYQSGFDPANTDHYCTVSLLLASGTENPSWVTGWYGVEHDAVAGVTDCADETPLGADPLGVVMASGPNGVEIGGPLDPYVTQLLTDAGANPAMYFGAGLRLPLIGEAGQMSYGSAFEVDANQNLVLTDGALTQLDPSVLPIAPGHVLEALYQVNSVYFFQF